MGKSSPAPPPPPDPVKTAQAQTGSNIGTAIANAYIGNPNVVGPQGTTTNKVVGYNQIHGPNGETYDIPQYEQNTTLSPEQQRLYDQQTRLGSDLNNLAIGQTGRLSGILGAPVDASGLPQFNVAPNTNTTNFAAGINPSATDFSAAARALNPTNYSRGLTDQSLGLTNDFSKDRTAVEDALFARLNPQLERDRNALESKLVNQGFQRGTDAFNSAMDEYNRQVNDQRLGITAQGLNEQQGLYGMARDRAGFGASEQDRLFNAQRAEEQRAFDQAMASGQFGSSEQARAFAQAMQAGQFGSQEENRAFNTAMSGAQFGNQARQQSLQEMLALRNQPINEISALMSGGQVSLPNTPQYNAPQVANTDIGGYTYNTAALQNDQYKQQLAQQNAMMGGLFGLGSAGILGGMKFGLNPLAWGSTGKA